MNSHGQGQTAVVTWSLQPSPTQTPQPMASFWSSQIARWQALNAVQFAGRTRAPAWLDHHANINHSWETNRVNSLFHVWIMSSSWWEWLQDWITGASAHDAPSSSNDHKLSIHEPNRDEGRIFKPKHSCIIHVSNLPSKKLNCHKTALKKNPRNQNTLSVFA